MKQIIISVKDYDRLLPLLQHHASYSDNGGNIGNLLHELKDAEKLPPDEIPAGVVTMNSSIRIRNLSNNKIMDIKLVYPKDADIKKGQVSILAPVGAAVLGYSVGDVISWDLPKGKTDFAIEEVYYQPEASGDFEL